MASQKELRATITADKATVFRREKMAKVTHTSHKGWDWMSLYDLYRSRRLPGLSTSTVNFLHLKASPASVRRWLDIERPSE